MPQVRGTIGLLPGADAIEEVVDVFLVAFVADVFDHDFVLAPLLAEFLFEGGFRDHACEVGIAALRAFPLVAEMHRGVRTAQQQRWANLVHL